MSRYALTLTDQARTEHGATSLAIGWDAPMGTYFLQLANDDAPDDQEPVPVWIGGDFGECEDVDAIIAEASRYSAEAANYRDRLIGDRQHRRMNVPPRAG